MEKTQPRIRIGITEMDFHHNGTILTAGHPFYGPANLKTLQELIKKDGGKEPTAPELTSFVHEYFNGNEPQAQEVTQIMKDGYFRGFTGILYVPKEEIAHFIDYPEFDEKSIVDKDNLLKRLNESRAQVPFKYLKSGAVAVEWREVGKHPYFVAWAGSEEGAGKLAELASKHSQKEAYIFVPDFSDLKEPIARVASLDVDWDGDGLGVCSNDLGYYGGGCAFRVKN